VIKVEGLDLGDEVQFPTNSDTIADEIDGKFGIVTKIGTHHIEVSVDGYTISVRPDEVEVP
jgi:hypothetical protein